MPQTLDERAARLLDLMREADAEAVTLDELEVVGIADPAAALLQLELAGYGLERVIDTTARGRELPCVRLARETAPTATLEFPRVRAPAEPPPPAPAPAPTRANPSPAVRVALLTLLGLVLLGLVRGALRSR